MRAACACFFVIFAVSVASTSFQASERSSLLLHRHARVLQSAVGTIAASAMCCLTVDTAPCRFNFSGRYKDAQSGVFNPAAMWHPDKGWLVLFRWDSCLYQKCDSKVSSYTEKQLRP